MEIRLLGPLEVICDERQVKLPLGQPRTLLILLALSDGETVATDRIVEALWRDSPPQSAAGVVQTYVSRLRKLLGDDSIRTSGGGYGLELRGGTRDVDEVVVLRERASHERPEEARATLLEALARFRGRPLADVADYEFAQAELRRLEGLRTAILAEWLDVELVLGRHMEVLPELEALVASEPLDEGMRARLMLALYHSGRQAEALKVYGDGRAVLDELGLEPGDGLRRLQRAILEHDPALAAPGSQEPAPLDSFPPASSRPSRRGRGARLVAALGALLLVTAAVATAVAVQRGDAQPLTVSPNSVAVIDPHSNRVVAVVPVGARPANLTSNPAGVWVTNQDDRTVTRIDAASLTVSATVSLGFEPTDIEATSSGGVWVLGGFDHTLWRLDPDGVTSRKLQFGERFGPLPAGYEKGRGGLTTDPLGVWLWLAHGNETTRFDAVTGQARGTIQAGGSWVDAIGVGAHGYVLDRTPARVTDSRGFRPCCTHWAIQVFDPARLVRTSRIVTNAGFSDVLLIDRTAWLVAPPGLLKVDDERGLIEKTIPLTYFPAAIAFADNSLWLTAVSPEVERNAERMPRPTTVLRIDPNSGEIEKAIEIGHPLAGVTASNGLLFLTVQAP